MGVARRYVGRDCFFRARARPLGRMRRWLIYHGETVTRGAGCRRNRDAWGSRGAFPPTLLGIRGDPHELEPVGPRKGQASRGGLRHPDVDSLDPRQSGLGRARCNATGWPNLGSTDAPGPASGDSRDIMACQAPSPDHARLQSERQVPGLRPEMRRKRYVTRPSTSLYQLLRQVPAFYLSSRRSPVLFSESSVSATSLPRHRRGGCVYRRVAAPRRAFFLSRPRFLCR